MWIVESQLFNCSTALWDAITDCKDCYGELNIDHPSCLEGQVHV